MGEIGSVTPVGGKRRVEVALAPLGQLVDAGGLVGVQVELQRAQVLAAAPDLFADQVEYHAKLSQHELRSVASEADLLVEAYAPLGGSASDMVEEAVLKEIAVSHDASPAQVAIAWLAQQDRVVVLPRSTNPERRRENLAALELDLTPDENARIDELSERRERNFDPPFAPDWRD